MKTLKKCSYCGEEKPLDEFGNNKTTKDKKQLWCKECTNKYKIKWINNYNKEYYIKYNKIYYQENKEILKQKNKIYYQENKENYKEQKKKYREENKEILKQKNKIYYQENKEKNKKKSKEYQKNKLKSDSLFKLNYNIRNLIRQSIKNKGHIKKSKTIDILGCSIDEFKQYLEKQFEPWMTWNNYGKYNGKEKYGWDIDHIIPISSAKTEEELLKLNHYTNLQPLDSFVNRCIKRNKRKY